MFSRVKLNSEISLRSMLMLALMSSENRAAASLAHAYPGGYDAFIRAMNAKARALGMMHTHYVEPTGLSIKNVSSAQDLVKLLKATREYPLLGAPHDQRRNRRVCPSELCAAIPQYQSPGV